MRAVCKPGSRPRNSPRSSFPLPVRKAAGLADAVTIARELARPGDVVLLSPACAAREDITTTKSADRFQSQEERGDRFAALVRALPHGAPV